MRYNLQGARTNARRGSQGPCQNAQQANDSRNGPWGDTMDKKQNNTFRYCFVNISGLPIPMNHEKQDLLTQAIQHNDIDLLGLAEIHLNFQRLTPHQQ